MRPRVALVLAGFVFAPIASCAGDDAAEAGRCVAGKQTSCDCSGGLKGVQICKADESGYEPCTSCGVAGNTGWPDAGGAGGSRGGTGGSGGASGGAGGSGGAQAGGGGGTQPDAAPTFSWKWYDGYGGPAYQPAPCSASVGVSGGKLVDPKAFFMSLVQGKDPNDWINVLAQIEPQLWACGLGQQRDSGGTPRGRLFLPHAGCPDASPPPGDTQAIFLGVRQEAACWDLKVDVVQEN